MIHSNSLRAVCVASFFAVGSLCLASYPETLFILDASGSMYEPVGNERKIDAAKRVMAQVVPALEPEVRVGLVAYGHRQPGSCTDIETLVPAGSDDRETLLRLVSVLEPKGKTPISSAILASASMLKTRDVETSIVLVSDGIETCTGNPCEVVRSLKEAGINFVLHVVGFDVDAAAAAQLECLANQGGGEFFTAADGNELLVALRTVSEGVAEKVEAARITAKNVGTGLGKLAVTMPAESAKSLHAIEITRVADGKIIKTAEKPDPKSLHPLVSGQYRVAALFKTPNYGSPTRTEIGVVNIKAKQVRELRLGAIALNLPNSLIEGDDWKAKIGVDAVELYDSGTENRVVQVLSNNNGHYNFFDKPMLPGVYDIRFHYKWAEAPTTVATQIVVKPGKTSTAIIDSGIRIRENDGDIVGWRLYRHAEQTADASEDGGLAPERSLAFEAKKEWNTSAPLWRPYLLPPGTFDIEVDIKGMTEPLPVAEAVSITPGELLWFDTGL